MSGYYTPLFDSLTTGTLCGRWPDVGLWPIVLSLADRYGVVDVTPAYLARVTGMKLLEVSACMGRFCEPDPYSRSSENGGARLVLIDPEHRDWGWRVVNHAKYRERARLLAKGATEVETGKNRDRMNDRRRPPETAVDPLLDKTRQDKTEERGSAAAQSPATSGKRKPQKTGFPEGFSLSPELERYAVDRLPGVDPVEMFASFRGKAEAKGWEYVSWPRAFQEFVRGAMPGSGHFAAGQYPRRAGSDITWR